MLQQAKQLQFTEGPLRVDFVFKSIAHLFDSNVHFLLRLGFGVLSSNHHTIGPLPNDLAEFVACVHLELMGAYRNNLTGLIGSPPVGIVGFDNVVSD